MKRSHIVRLCEDALSRFHEPKYCDLEKSMLYQEGGQVATITLTSPQVSILALLLLRYRTEPC